MIKDLNEGSRVKLQAIVGSMSRGVNATGAPYLNVELRDSSGSISSKKWDVAESDNDTFVVGNIVEVTMEIIKYRDSLQGKILSVRKLAAEEVDVTKFIKAPPIPKSEIKVRFDKLVNSIENKDHSGFKFG